MKKLTLRLIKSDENYHKKEKRFNYFFIFTDEFFTISVNHFDDIFLIFDGLNAYTSGSYDRMIY